MGFDPGRKILRRNLETGIALVRERYPTGDDAFLAGFLSGYLGAYVVATENAVRSLCDAPTSDGACSEYAGHDGVHMGGGY